MDLTIRFLGKEDHLEQIFDLFRTNSLLGPNYASTRGVWQFQYEKNPRSKSWSTIYINQENNAILGHFGLLPFPLTIRSQRRTGAYVSSCVTAKESRKAFSPFSQTKKTFPVVSLIEQCCRAAFADSADLVFCFSIIPFSFWKMFKFHNLSLETRTVWFLSPRELYGQYVQELKSRIKNGWRKIFIKSYALSLTLLQGAWKTARKIRHSLCVNDGAKIDLEEFHEFDQSLGDLWAKFVCDNPDLITYDREIPYLNWRFNNSSYSRYKFFIKGRLIGYCIILKHETKSRAPLHEIYEFIVLNAYLKYIPVLLTKMAAKQNAKIEFKHFLSCPYSRKMFRESARYGYQLFLRIPEVVRNKPRKAIMQPSFNFRMNRESPFIQRHEEYLKNTENWFINPLFFVPRYYE